MTVLGPDPVDEEVNAVLALLEAGSLPRDVERQRVDVKEEAGRRKNGQLLPAAEENEAAAASLAAAATCMANTPGGGALLVGIADDGPVLGTALGIDWLRYRLYELTDRQVTAGIREVRLRDERVLVIRITEAVAPVQHQKKIRWRVGAACVEVDVATWTTGRLHRLGHDWSAQRSGHRLDEARPAAVQRAREYLTAAGESGPADLARASDIDLLTRLNVVTSDGWLTNAGALTFVGHGDPAIDYIHRDVDAGDSTNRVRRAASLLEELYDVEIAIRANNRTNHVDLGSGLAIGQLRDIPPSAVREAIVNGLVHRDWNTTEPTVVEHVGSRISITSPGGFVGSVTPENILRHPSTPRYRALAELFAKLRIAEREGVGVKRMVRDMLRQGSPEPLITSVVGPFVRVLLAGAQPDLPWLRLVASISPAENSRDLTVLLSLDQLTRSPWVDARRLAPRAQWTVPEAESALQDLLRTELRDQPLFTRIDGVPSGSPLALRLSDTARGQLRARLEPLTAPARRSDLALEWARSRGRVSSSELADLCGIAVNAAGSVLRALDEAGELKPSRPNRRGAGFHYLPA